VPPFERGGVWEAGGGKHLDGLAPALRAGAEAELEQLRAVGQAKEAAAEFEDARDEGRGAGEGVLGPVGTGGAWIGVWVGEGEGEGEEGVPGVEDEEVGRREGGIVVCEARGRERDLPALGAGESVDDDDAGFTFGRAAAAVEEEVAARGGQEDRALRAEIGAIGERLREDELVEGGDDAGFGVEDERGQAGAEEVGGGGAEEEPPGAADGREGVDGAEAGEEAPQHLRERQLRQAAPVAELRHRGHGGGGGRACLRRFHFIVASRRGGV